MIVSGENVSFYSSVNVSTCGMITRYDTNPSVENKQSRGVCLYTV